MIKESLQSIIGDELASDVPEFEIRQSDTRTWFSDVGIKMCMVYSIRSYKNNIG